MHIKLLAGVAGLVTVTAFAAYRLGHYAGEEAGRAAVRSSFDWLDLAAPNGASPRDAREALAADFARAEAAAPGVAPPAPGSTSPVHAAALRAATPADLLTIETEFAQAYATYALAARADQAGIETLIRDAQAINRPDDRVHITSVFLSRYVEIDPRAALEFLRAARLEPKRSYLAHLFASWTYEDVDAAIAAAAALSTGDRMAANEGIVRVFDDQGATKLAEIARRLSVGGTPAALDPVAVVTLAATDPRAALDQVELLPRDVRNNVAMAIGAAWASIDAEDAYRNVRARPVDPLKQPLLAGVFLQWVATAPERVFEILDAGVPADEQRLIVSYAVARLARARPQAAFELVTSLDNADAHDAALRVTLQQWAQQDAPGAVAALETLDDSAAQAHGLIVAREYGG